MNDEHINQIIKLGHALLGAQSPLVTTLESINKNLSEIKNRLDWSDENSLQSVSVSIDNLNESVTCVKGVLEGIQSIMPSG